MKRLLVCLLLLVAAPVYAQRIGAGSVGLVKPVPGDRISLVPTDQFITYTYPWDFAPVGTNNGWYVQQSTAAGVTITAEPPFLVLLAATQNKRVLLTEGGSTLGFNLGSPCSITADGEATITVPLFNLDQVGGGTTAWFQLAYGDTTNFVVNKVPQSGFGIIVTGSTNANNAYAQAATVTGYVSSGADTTYTPLAVSGALTFLKLVIHADPGGGPVTFWINDVLKATITSPARTASGNSQVALWENGQGSLAFIGIGPMTIQRAWP